MSATAIGLIVFVMVFGSALLAVYAHSALPEHHLDRALARYGPETNDPRALLQRSVAATVDRFWRTEGVRRITIDPNVSPVEAIAEKIEELQPHDETQRLLRSQA